MQLKSWLDSSQNPGQISVTIKGAVLGVSATIVFVAAQLFHIQLSASDVTALATELGALAGVIVFLYGLLFKGVVYVGSVK